MSQLDVAEGRISNKCHCWYVKLVYLQRERGFYVFWSTQHKATWFSFSSNLLSYLSFFSSVPVFLIAHPVCPFVPFLSTWSFLFLSRFPFSFFFSLSICSTFVTHCIPSSYPQGVVAAERSRGGHLLEEPKMLPFRANTFSLQVSIQDVPQFLWSIKPFTTCQVTNHSSNHKVGQALKANTHLQVFFAALLLGSLINQTVGTV